eukprot:2392052-Lingulodinium_polyedra.AAC.1
MITSSERSGSDLVYSVADLAQRILSPSVEELQHVLQFRVAPTLPPEFSEEVPEAVMGKDSAQA